MSLCCFPSRVQAAIMPPLESAFACLKTQLSRVVDLALGVLNTLWSWLTSWIPEDEPIAVARPDPIIQNLEAQIRANEMTHAAALRTHAQRRQEIRQHVEQSNEEASKKMDDVIAKIDAKIAECPDTDEGNKKRKSLESLKKATQRLQTSHAELTRTFDGDI